MEARLKSAIWVAALLRTADARGQPGVVVRKGDPDAGAILAVLRGRDGQIVLSQTRTPQGNPAWMQATGPEPVQQDAVDRYTSRCLRSDPDVWIIEFETPDLRPPFEAEVV